MSLADFSTSVEEQGALSDHHLDVLSIVTLFMRKTRTKALLI